jgi:hypothetical protein
MKKKWRQEQGVLSLEASIVVTIFIFLMLYLYSFFVVFEARNQIGHAVLAATNSLSIDAYANSTLGDSKTVGQVFYRLYTQNSSENDFTSSTKWYESSTTTDENGETTLDADFLATIETRFYAYLAGGDADKAENVAERYHIKNGLNGFDFSASYVDDDKLYFSVKYTIEYEFQVFGLSGLDMEQSACSRLWKQND